MAFGPLCVGGATLVAMTTLSRLEFFQAPACQAPASARLSYLVCHFARFGRMKYGVADIVDAATSGQDLQETYTPMLGAVRQFIHAYEGSGNIRAGTDLEDFLVLVGLLWRIPPTLSGEARVRRLLDLAFRGLGANDQ